MVLPRCGMENENNCQARPRAVRTDERIRRIEPGWSGCGTPNTTHRCAGLKAPQPSRH